MPRSYRRRSSISKRTPYGPCFRTIRISTRLSCASTQKSNCLLIDCVNKNFEIISMVRGLFDRVIVSHLCL
uniref:ORF31 n=1 Tax=Latid herpesvirus 1 TaxID=3096545 RepID=A0AB33V6N8_9VIRU